MESFSVDKSFYDIGANDLKELWDSDLGPMTEVFKVAADDDWNPTTGLLDVKPPVILHDRLMTDAALGTIPIKAEHSYCSLTTSSSEVDSPPNSPLKMDDMDDECFPPMALQTTRRISRDTESPLIVVKDEPMSETESPISSCPPSPSPQSVVYSEQKCEHKSGQSILKQPAALLLATRANLLSQQSHHVVMPSLNIKVEPANSGFTLPPTPPSSTSSDSEGNVSPSHPSSPSRRLFLSAASHSTPSGTASTRQPIQTPLISSQPKGSTGVLMLTEEEKRTLLAEGYPIPTRLPLTKAEEKSLKKIRRKIKNKISAQESRRKKKEYMDALERKVEMLSTENSEYRKKITSLEDTNCSLVSQLNKLQAIVARAQNSNFTQHTRSTAAK